MWIKILRCKNYHKGGMNMKKTYVQPMVVSYQTIEEEGVVPLAAMAGGAALLAGYAAGRAVTNMMKARPLSKLPNMNGNRK